MKNGLNLLEGDLRRTIIKLGYPIALSSLVQTLYNLADAFWLGKLGRDAVSAPIIAFFVLFFILSLAMGFSVAGTSLVSQYIGAGKKEEANKATGNLMTFLVLLSIALVVLGLAFDRAMLRVMATPDATFELTLSYFRIMMLGMPLAFPIFVYQSVMNGYGDTVSPLKITIAAALVNVILDPILIFGWLGMPAMGIEGAAWTTVITRALASGVGIYLFFSGKKGIKLKLHHLKPDFKNFSLMLKVGTPSALGMAGTSLGFIVLIGFVNMFGTTVVSAYGIAMRLVHAFMLPAMGISSAVTAIVGQNLGAGNIKRAKASVVKGIKMILWVIIPPVILMEFFGEQMTKWFIPGDPEVHRIGGMVFLIASGSLIFHGISSVLEGAFQGSGFTVPVMVTNIARLWIFRLPFAYIVSMVILDGPNDIDASVGIWWSITFSTFAALLIILPWYLKGKWARPRIETD
ncbi:MAG: MATE family efflux transporter [bacterium]|nr:MATE family efflux transporter [bacterium]